MSLLNPGNGASQETELYFKTLNVFHNDRRQRDKKASGSNFIDTRKLSKNNLPLKCGNLKCELPNTMQSSIDIFIPFPRPLCIEQLHRCREDFISDKKDAEIKHPCRKSQLCGVISFYLGEFHNNSVTPPERHPSWYACTSSFQCQLVLTHM
ncbi:uncharacterized protein LOC123839428 isoform X11 [Mirounga angustirostris]|uniref:uncharacterized protein LOC123839428 isoform X11 n=1 Tax=Mirounga angustirostris TaxID=9716 RepID=UPI00313EBE63